MILYSLGVFFTYKYIPSYPEKRPNEVDQKIGCVVLIVAKDAKNGDDNITKIEKHWKPHITKKVKNLTFHQ